MKSMRRLLATLCIIVWAMATWMRGDDLPSKLSFDRYQAMVQRSPFAVATAVAVPAPGPSFGKDLYVANAAKSPGDDMVTIASTTDKDFKKYLGTRAPVDGYAIARIAWSDKVGETRVTITKDGQEVTLSFNQMIVAQPLPNHASNGNPPPPAFSQQSNVQRPVSFPNPNSRPNRVVQPDRAGQGSNP
jgi:hypothetical protein